VTATAVDDEGGSVSVTDDATVTFTDVAPLIRITKTANPTHVPETGGNVTFTFLVENIGQEDVTLTTLTDTKFGDLNGKGTCDVPQTILIGGSYSCEYMVSLSGDNLTPHTNVVTATAVDDDGTPATDDDDEAVTFDVVGMSKVTDSSLCEFDVDPVDGNQFRLSYIQDKAGSRTYRLNSSNPGQFYYNVFYAGLPGEGAHLTIQIPYPFVTQGAVPIHVYSDYGISDGGCFLPSGDITADFTITTSKGNLSSSGAPVILLTDYGLNPVVGTTLTEVNVDGIVPASGKVYVTIHLDYGLKKTTGWTNVNGDAKGSGTLKNVTIEGPQDYNFSFTAGSLTESQVPQSVNNFSKSKTGYGFVGVVTEENGDPKEDVKVEIYGPSSKTKPLATVKTNAEGIYFYEYKNPKAATFTIKLPEYGLSQTVKLPKNGFMTVNFENVP